MDLVMMIITTVVISSSSSGAVTQSLDRTVSTYCQQAKKQLTVTEKRELPDRIGMSFWISRTVECVPLK